MAESRANKELSVKPQMNQIQTAYDKTKKDNEFVYHERVPDFKNLGVVERAALAKTTPIKFPISEDFRGNYYFLLPIFIIISI